MRTALICHKESELDCDVLARWLSSFSSLVGVIEIHEPRSARTRRARREIERVGALRFLDVIAFQLYYRLFLAPPDRAGERRLVERFRARYPERPRTERLGVANPNSDQAKEFLESLKPELVVARCKYLLKEEIFSIPQLGTYVLHPGICPEYRNAHGCFWALANDDLKKVGLTLLRIDSGIDTGPVYGYYTYKFDELAESHHLIQTRVLFENLAAIKQKLEEIASGVAEPTDTSDRPSGNWGQPWLSKHLKWKRSARRRAK